MLLAVEHDIETGNESHSQLGSDPDENDNINAKESRDGKIRYT
jgi:hypothetical protein